MSTVSTLILEDHLNSLKKDRQELLDKAKAVREFVTNPNSFDSTKVKAHTLEKLTGELASVVVTVQGDTPQAKDQVPVRELPTSEETGLQDFQEKIDKAGGSDWKTKLAFVIFVSVIVVAAVVAGLVGPQVPLRNPDGSIVTTTNWINGTLITQNQMTTEPLLSAQWVVALVLLVFVAAIVYFSPSILGGFLALFAKKPEPVLSAEEKHSKELADKINSILKRYINLFVLQTCWQDVTSENLPEEDYYTAETPEWLYSLHSQNELLFAKFAVTKLNEILFTCNAWIRQQENYIIDQLARINSPSGAPAKAGA